MQGINTDSDLLLLGFIVPFIFAFASSFASTDIKRLVALTAASIGLISIVDMVFLFPPAGTPLIGWITQFLTNLAGYTERDVLISLVECFAAVAGTSIGYLARSLLQIPWREPNYAELL